MRKLMCEKWKCSSQWFSKHTNHFIKVVCHWANETELLLFLLPRHHWKEIELEKEFMDSASFSFWQLLQRHQGKLSSIRSMKKVIFFMVNQFWKVHIVLLLLRKGQNWQQSFFMNFVNNRWSSWYYTWRFHSTFCVCFEHQFQKSWCLCMAAAARK